jgi:hypothetical protein
MAAEESAFSCCQVAPEYGHDPYFFGVDSEKLGWGGWNALTKCLLCSKTMMIQTTFGLQEGEALACMTTVTYVPCTYRFKISKVDLPLNKIMPQWSKHLTMGEYRRHRHEDLCIP